MIGNVNTHTARSSQVIIPIDNRKHGGRGTQDGSGVCSGGGQGFGGTGIPKIVQDRRDTIV